MGGPGVPATDGNSFFSRRALSLKQLSVILFDLPTGSDGPDAPGVRSQASAQCLMGKGGFADEMHAGEIWFTRSFWKFLASL